MSDTGKSFYTFLLEVILSSIIGLYFFVGLFKVTYQQEQQQIRNIQEIQRVQQEQQQILNDILKEIE